MNKIITISIIEDDVKFALLLKKLIEGESDLACVSLHHNLKSSLNDLAALCPDVVLVDIQLPDGLGSEYIQVLKKVTPGSLFVMCTSFDDDEYLFTSLKNGACGYLIKSDTPDKIVNAIHDAMNGGAPMSPGIARKVVGHFQQRVRSLNELSDKENEVLNLLAEGLLYKEIAAQLNIALDTVKKHAGSIYKKLEVSNRTEAVNKMR